MFGMDMTSFIVATFLGTIGFGYFMYGKKSGNMISLGCGLGLMVFPYFITNTIFMLIMGIVLMIVPFVV
jgi:hypothetical protein